MNRHWDTSLSRWGLQCNIHTRPFHTWTRSQPKKPMKARMNTQESSTSTSPRMFITIVVNTSPSMGGTAIDHDIDSLLLSITPQEGGPSHGASAHVPA